MHRTREDDARRHHNGPRARPCRKTEITSRLPVYSSATQHRRLLNIVGYSTSSATQHRRLLNIVGYSTSSVTQHRR